HVGIRGGRQLGQQTRNGRGEQLGVARRRREALEIARGGVRIGEAERLQCSPQASRRGAAAGGPEVGGGGVQTGRPSRSAARVRMRIDSLIGSTKTLPSPIEPVFAAPAIVSTTFLARASPTTTSIFTLGRKSTVYSEPR